jgi:chondroitin 4-sulfotransferase 11
MSLYCKKYNYIFIHNPKCAGTTMSLLLERAGSKKGSGHKSIQEYKNEGVNIDDTFKWGFTRNPYDRVLSAYKYHLGFIDKFVSTGIPLDNLSTFEAYVHNLQKNMPGALHKPKGLQHLQHQHKYLCIEGKKALDFIGKYENLKNDWEHVCSTLFQSTLDIESETNNAGRAYGHPALPLEQMLALKTHSGHPYLKDYTTEMIEKVNEIYAKDFEIFGYEMDKR